MLPESVISPNQYRSKILTGRPFVYYRGVRRADGSRGMAEYFGSGVVGSVYLDPTNDPATPKAKRKWICEIDDYRPFPTPVPAKDGSSYLENIPANFWGVAVRELPESVYGTIMSRAVLPTGQLDLSPDQLNLPPIGQVAPELATTTLLVARPPKADRVAGEPMRTAMRRSKYSAALGKRGEEIALSYLRRTLSSTQAATLRWTAAEGDLSGWDIEYMSPAELNAIEVKASAGPAFPSIELSANEWEAAKRLGAAYRLMLVAQVRTTSPQIQIIDNPAALVKQGQIALEPVMWRLVMRESD
jgi:Domain of unknown function (DUF3883)